MIARTFAHPSQVPGPINTAASGWIVMRQLIFVTVVLALLGVWIHPLLTGAVDTPAFPKQPSKPAEINTPVQFELIRGKTGFWRLAKTVQGVWWFLSPQ